MQCPKCKMQIENDVKICPFCGKNLDNPQENNVVQESPSVTTTQQNNVTPEPSTNLESNDVVTPSTPLKPNQPANSSKKKNNLVWIIVGAIVLVAAIVIGVFFFLKKSPKEIFERSIDQVYHSLNDSLVEKVTSEKGTYDVTMKIESKNASIKAVSDIINKLSISGNYEVDYEKLIMNTSLRTKYDNATLLDLDLYTSKNQGYLYLPGLYDKYIKLDVSGNTLETVDKKSLSVVLEEVTKTVKKSLKKEYFSTIDTKITINGKETKVKQNILEIDTKRAYEMQKVVLTELKNNDKFLTSMSKLGEVSKDELKKSLEDTLKEDISESTTSEKIKVSLYTKGMNNKVVGYQFDVVNDNQSATVAIQNDKDNYYFQVSDQDEEMLKGSLLLNENKSSLKISMTNLADITFDLSCKKEDNVKVEEKQVNNAVSQYSLTEADNQKIQQALLQNEGFVKLVTDIQKVMMSLYEY